MTTPPLILVSASGAVSHANHAAVELLGEPNGRRCHEYVRARDATHGGICSATCVTQLVRERHGAQDRDQAVVRSKSHRMICTAMGPQTTVQLLPQAAPRPRIATLTPREMEVMDRVAEGLTTAVIAKRLGISPATVRTHVEHAREKLGARTRAEAVARLAEARHLAVP